MAERKRFEGEGATDYIGTARAMLAMLKHSMLASRLMQHSQTVVLGDGVQITVSSVFGQDTIDIHAPKEMEAVVARQIDQAELTRLARLEDPAFDPSMPVLIKATIDEKVSVQGGGGVLTFRKPGPITGGTPGSGGVVIGGMRTPKSSSNTSYPVYWSKATGVVELGTGAGSIGMVLGLSSDGTLAVGYIEIGGNRKATCWRTPTSARSQPAVVGPHAGYSEARTVSGDNAKVYGFSTGANNVDGGFQWDGQDGHTFAIYSPVPSRQNGGGSYVISADGTVRAEQGRYQVNGGAWTDWAPASSTDNYSALCVTTTAATGGTSGTPTTLTTTVAFSG